MSIYGADIAETMKSLLEDHYRRMAAELADEIPRAVSTLGPHERQRIGMVEIMGRARGLSAGVKLEINEGDSPLDARKAGLEGSSLPGGADYRPQHGGEAIRKVISDTAVRIAGQHAIQIDEEFARAMKKDR